MATKRQTKVKTKKIKKLLIANRGEIALRVIRAARDLGIKTVAIYSRADEGSLPVRMADERVFIGQSRAKESYLNLENVIAAAIQTGADAVHPGYGFFAENAEFAAAVVKEKMLFVGPTPEVISLMGDKEQARHIAKKVKVPIVPGTDGNITIKEAKQFAKEVGFPVIIKAVAGGSGRGMRIVEKASELEEKLTQAQAEALASFNNASVFIEKFLKTPRHIEVQVAADNYGNTVSVGDRECSVQRRHQKLIEEAPAPRLHKSVREKLHKAAVQLTKKVKYTGVGTIEFLVDGGESAKDKFYFLEMNTRIQVEHPVTEEVTGVDLVRLQLEIAEGKKLPFKQKDIVTDGHAIEFRVNAEVPSEGFMPAVGKICYIHPASGPGVREDSWVEAGTEVSLFYDSLLSKLIIKGNTREEAIIRAQRALDEYVLEGVETNLGFHRFLVREPVFVNAELDVYWVSREYKGQTRPGKMVGPLLLTVPKEQ